MAADFIKNQRRGLERAMLRVAAIFISVIIALIIAPLVRESSAIHELAARYGYIGLTLFAFVSGFNLAVPLPPISFLPVLLAAGLSFWPVVILIAAGTTFADLCALWIGQASREVIAYPQERLFARLEQLRDRYYWAPVVALFVFAAFVPFPNELLVIPLGFLGYRATELLPAVFLGNFGFNALAAIGVLQFFPV